jgi:hypothetical protein
MLLGFRCVYGLQMVSLEGMSMNERVVFFVNLSNSNAANLDFQNEGFSVFGRIAGSGINLFNQINDKPSSNYTVSVDGVNRTLEDVPVNATSAPATLDPAKLIKITSISALAPLQYQVSSSLPAIATAAISNGNVIVSGVAAGTSRITVEATDLDGNKVSQFFDVTVPLNGASLRLAARLISRFLEGCFADRCRLRVRCPGVPAESGCFTES